MCESVATRDLHIPVLCLGISHCKNPDGRISLPLKKPTPPLGGWNGPSGQYSANQSHAPTEAQDPGQALQKQEKGILPRQWQLSPVASSSEAGTGVQLGSNNTGVLTW